MAVQVGDERRRFYGVDRFGPGWRALIFVGARREDLGRFATEIEAAIAYDRRASYLGRKELNFPEGLQAAKLLDAASGNGQKPTDTAQIFDTDEGMGKIERTKDPAENTSASREAKKALLLHRKLDGNVNTCLASPPALEVERSPPPAKIEHAEDGHLPATDCFRWVSSGHCYKGANCAFTHSRRCPQQSPEMQPQTSPLSSLDVKSSRIAPLTRSPPSPPSPSIVFPALHSPQSPLPIPECSPPNQPTKSSPRKSHSPQLSSRLPKCSPPTSPSRKWTQRSSDTRQSQLDSPARESATTTSKCPNEPADASMQKVIKRSGSCAESSSSKCVTRFGPKHPEAPSNTVENNVLQSKSKDPSRGSTRGVSERHKVEVQTNGERVTCAICNTREGRCTCRKPKFVRRNDYEKDRNERKSRLVEKNWDKAELLRNKCFKWMILGKCAFVRCRYEHSNETRASVDTTADPELLKVGICYAWFESGTCRQGATCNFSHDTQRFENLLKTRRIGRKSTNNPTRADESNRRRECHRNSSNDISRIDREQHLHKFVEAGRDPWDARADRPFRRRDRDRVLACRQSAERDRRGDRDRSADHDRNEKRDNSNDRDRVQRDHIADRTRDHNIRESSKDRDRTSRDRSSDRAHDRIARTPRLQRFSETPTAKGISLGELRRWGLEKLGYFEATRGKGRTSPPSLDARALNRLKVCSPPLPRARSPPRSRSPPRERARSSDLARTRGDVSQGGLRRRVDIRDLKYVRVPRGRDREWDRHHERVRSRRWSLDDRELEHRPGNREWDRDGRSGRERDRDRRSDRERSICGDARVDFVRTKERTRPRSDSRLKNQDGLEQSKVSEIKQTKRPKDTFRGKNRVVQSAMESEICRSVSREKKVCGSTRPLRDESSRGKVLKDRERSEDLDKNDIVSSAGLVEQHVNTSQNAMEKQRKTRFSQRLIEPPTESSARGEEMLRSGCNSSLSSTGNSDVANTLTVHVSKNSEAEKVKSGEASKSDSKAAKIQRKRQDIQGHVGDTMTKARKTRWKPKNIITEASSKEKISLPNTTCESLTARKVPQNLAKPAGNLQQCRVTLEPMVHKQINKKSRLVQQNAKKPIEPGLRNQNSNRYPFGEIFRRATSVVASLPSNSAPSEVRAQDAPDTDVVEMDVTPDVALTRATSSLIFGASERSSGEKTSVTSSRGAQMQVLAAARSNHPVKILKTRYVEKPIVSLRNPHSRAISPHSRAISQSPGPSASQMPQFLESKTHPSIQSGPQEVFRAPRPNRRFMPQPGQTPMMESSKMRTVVPDNGNVATTQPVPQRRVWPTGTPERLVSSSLGSAANSASSAISSFTSMSSQLAHAPQSIPSHLAKRFTESIGTDFSGKPQLSLTTQSAIISLDSVANSSLSNHQFHFKVATPSNRGSGLNEMLARGNDEIVGTKTVRSHNEPHRNDEISRTKPVVLHNETRPSVQTGILGMSNAPSSRNSSLVHEQVKIRSKSIIPSEKNPQISRSQEPTSQTAEKLLANSTPAPRTGGNLVNSAWNAMRKFTSTNASTPVAKRQVSQPTASEYSDALKGKKVWSKKNTDDEKTSSKAESIATPKGFADPKSKNVVRLIAIANNLMKKHSWSPDKLAETLNVGTLSVIMFLHKRWRGGQSSPEFLKLVSGLTKWTTEMEVERDLPLENRRKNAVSPSTKTMDFSNKALDQMKNPSDESSSSLQMKSRHRETGQMMMYSARDGQVQPSASVPVQQMIISKETAFGACRPSESINFQQRCPSTPVPTAQKGKAPSRELPKETSTDSRVKANRKLDHHGPKNTATVPSKEPEKKTVEQNATSEIQNAVYQKMTVFTSQRIEQKRVQRGKMKSTRGKMKSKRGKMKSNEEVNQDRPFQSSEEMASTAHFSPPKPSEVANGTKPNPPLPADPPPPLPKAKPRQASSSTREPAPLQPPKSANCPAPSSVGTKPAHPAPPTGSLASPCSPTTPKSFPPPPSTAARSSTPPPPLSAISPPPVLTAAKSVLPPPPRAAEPAASTSTVKQAPPPPPVPSVPSPQRSPRDEIEKKPLHPIPTPSRIPHKSNQTSIKKNPRTLSTKLAESAMGRENMGNPSSDLERSDASTFPNSKIQRACGHASDNAELKTQSEGIKHDSREILECPASDDKHLRSDEFDNRVKAASDHLSRETKTVAPSVQMSVSTFEHSKATEIPALPPKLNLTSSRSNKKDEKLSVEKAKTPNWNGAKTRTDKTNVSAKKTLLSEGSANCNEKTTLSTSSEDEKETPSRNLSVQGKPEEEESGTCEICKKKHDGSYGTGRYCSKECRYALTGRKKTSDQIITGVDNDPKDTKVGPRGPKERRRSGRRTTKLDNSQKHTSRRKKSLRSSSKVDNGPRDTSRKKKSGRGATEVDSSPKDTSRKKTSGRSTKVDKSPKDIRRKTISGCSLTDVDDGPNDTKCEVCNTLHNGSYGTGRYCSKECRYTRTRCTKRAMEQKNGMHKQQKTKETRGNESRSKRVRQKTEFYSPGYPRVKSKLTLVVEDILRSKSAKKSKLDKEDKVCRKDKDARMKSGLRRSGRSKADLKKEPRQDEKDISLGTKCNRRGIATRSNSTEIFDERKIKTHKSRSAVAKEIHSGVKPGFKRRPRRPLTTSTKKTKTTDGSKENDSGERRSRPQEKVKSKPLPSSSRKSKAHHNSYKRPTTVDPKTLPNKKLTWNQFQRIHLGKPNMTLAWKEYLQDKRLCGQFAKAEAITFNEYEIRRMKKQKEATRDEYEIYCYLVSYYNTNNDEKKETLHVKRKSSDFPRTIESSEKRARICRRDSNASKRSDTSELRKLGRDQREVSKKKDQQSGASTFESAKIGPSLSLQELGEKENPKRSLVEEQSSSRQGSPQSDAEKNRRGGRVDKPGVTAALPPSINPPQPSQIFSKQFSSGTKNGKACLFPKTDSRTALSTSWVHNIEAHEPPGPTINVGASHSENGEISCHEVDAKSIEPLMKTGSTNSQIDLAPRGDNQNEDVQPGSVMNADAKTASSNNTISANDREESSKATKPDLEHIQPSSKDNNACRVLAVAEMLFQAKTIPEMVHAASVVPGILSAGSEVVESRSEHGPKIAPTTNNSTRSGSQLTHEPPLNRKPRTSVLPEGRHPQSQPSTGNSETVMKTLMPQSQSVPATAFRTTAKNVIYPATAHNHIMPTQVKLSVGSLGTKEMMPKPKASKSAAQDSAVHVSKSSARVARQPVVQRIVGMFKQTEVPEVAVAARQVEITALKSAKAKPVPFMQEETRSVPGPASKSVESTVVPMAPLRVPAKTLKAKQRPEAKSTPMCQTIQAVNRMPMEKPMKRSMSVAKGAQAMNHRLVALPTQVVAKQTVAKPTGGGKQAAGAGLTSPTIATKQTHACPKMTPKLAPSKPENSKHMSHASVRGTPIHERNVGVDTNFIKGGPNSRQDRRKRNFPHVTNPYPNFNSPCRSCTSIPIIPPRNVQNAGPHFINTICWPSSSFHSSQNPTSAFHNSLQTLSISSVVPQSPALFRSQPQIHSHLIPSPTPPSMINHLIPPPATVGAVGAPRNPRSILEGRNHSFNNGQKRAAVWQNPWQGYAEPVCPRPDVHALPLHGSTTQVSGTQFRKGANVHSQRSVPSQRSPAHDRFRCAHCISILVVERITPGGKIARCQTCKNEQYIPTPHFGRPTGAMPEVYGLRS